MQDMLFSSHRGYSGADAEVSVIQIPVLPAGWNPERTGFPEIDRCGRDVGIFEAN
jgi:hypothetical protein